MIAVEPDGRTGTRRFKGNGGRGHQKSFIEAVRSNDRTVFPILPHQAHPSESVMHLANASYRMGDLLSSSELESSIAGHDDLLEIVDEQKTQLAAWGAKDPQYYSGPSIRVKPATGEVTTPGVGPELLGPDYRKGYELSKLV